MPSSSPHSEPAKWNRYSMSNAAVETLAHHFIEAGDYEPGLKYAKQAAADAERLFAYDEAVSAYERALECAEALGLEGEQATLEESLGNVLAARPEPLHLVHPEDVVRIAPDEQPVTRLEVRVTDPEPAVEDAVTETEQLLHQGWVLVVVAPVLGDERWMQGAVRVLGQQAGDQV